MANDNHRPSKEVEQLTLVARENLRHILEGWVYYVNVGEAIDAYRRQLFRELGITKPTHQYKEIMGRYLKDNEFHRINKSTRTFFAEVHRSSARNREVAGDTHRGRTRRMEWSACRLGSLAGQTGKSATGQTQKLFKKINEPSTQSG